MAFEAENMRLANELQDERHKNTEKVDSTESILSSHYCFKARVNTLTAEKDQLLLNCSKLKAE